jgi:hypothetical protein
LHSERERFLVQSQYPAAHQPLVESGFESRFRACATYVPNCYSAPLGQLSVRKEQPGDGWNRPGVWSNYVIPSRSVEGHHADGCSREEPGRSFVAHEYCVPKPVHTLLTHLHLDDAPQAERQAAIRALLRGHPPGRAMTSTRERNGFGGRLDE